MHPIDRKKLEELRISAEAIAKADEVLAFWGTERLFATCSYCKKLCYNPDLPGKHRRKKLPAELFWKRELLGFRDDFSEVICMTCDDEHFQ